MKKFLSALLLLAAVPLFAKPLPSSGPERKAAISKIHGRIAIVHIGWADYTVAVVPFGAQDLCVAYTNYEGVGCWNIVPLGTEDFKIAFVSPGAADFRITVVPFGGQGIR